MDNNKSPKSKKVTLILSCLFVGGHRFYTGKIWSGIFQLITAGGLLFWQFSDIVDICRNRFRDSEDRLVTSE